MAKKQKKSPRVKTEQQKLTLTIDFQRALKRAIRNSQKRTEKLDELRQVDPETLLQPMTL